MKRTLTANARSSWRIRTRHKKTSAEKEALKLKRKEHREAYAEALSAANQVVLDQAKHMHEVFGRHSCEYYFEEILQCCRSMKSTRRPSRWNAFVKKETERINNGMARGIQGDNC
jgi:hypothetical protein